MPVGTTQGLITRCPDCATAFRARAEQLSAREGQVRCGRCGCVFHAIENAIADPELPAKTPPEDAVMTGQDEPDHAFDAVDRPSHEDRDEAHASPALPEKENVPMSAEADGSSTAQPEAIDEPAAPAGTALAESDAFVETAPASLQPDAIRAAAPSRPDEARLQKTNKAATAGTVEPLEWEFGRPKRPAGLVSRWVGVPAVLVLLGVLLGQVGYHLRGDLVLLFPSIRPAAEQACEWAGCGLPSPQRAELMSIESSELQADSTNPTVMVLSATLRNRAPFPQAPPALELTLTDLQDQPLARRVLSASDYSVRGVQNNLFPASSELPIKVYFDASAVKATGYRLYLFYP